MEQNDVLIDSMFGDKAIRWYQIAARNQTISAVEQGQKRILIVLPTGAGKTITIAASLGHPDMKRALNVPATRKMRVLFVAHKHRLMTQAEQTFVDVSDVELITQSAFSDIPESVLAQGWDVCVIDEAHHESMQSIQLKLDKLGDKPVIGLTATPDRADGCIVKFDVIVAPISREQAVAEGYLAKTSIHSFVDVPTKTKTLVLKDIMAKYASQMGQTMVFVKTKQEVVELSNFLRDAGYSVVSLLSQRNKEVDQILTDFSSGKIQFIINCFKISEGVDVKGCTDVVLGRTVGSYSLLNQIVGRASRPDSSCAVWELINPFSGDNLDTTTIVGTPESHRLISREKGAWVERSFDYVTHRTSKQLGIASGIRIGGDRPRS